MNFSFQFNITIEKARPEKTRANFRIRLSLLEKLLLIFSIIQIYMKVPPEIPFVIPLTISLV